MKFLFKKALTYHERELSYIDLIYFLIAIVSIIFTLKLVLIVATVITVGLYYLYKNSLTLSKQENEKITTTMIAYILMAVVVYFLF